MDNDQKLPAAAPKPTPTPTPAAPTTPSTPKLTGEARLNAILRIFHDKHGFTFPTSLYDPKTDK